MLVLERKLANTEAPFTPNDITSAVVRKRLVGTTEVLYILPTSEPGADFGHLSSDILTTVKIILQRMSKPADNTQQLIDKEMHKLWNLVLVE